MQYQLPAQQFRQQVLHVLDGYRKIQMSYERHHCAMEKTGQNTVKNFIREPVQLQPVKNIRKARQPMMILAAATTRNKNLY